MMKLNELEYNKKLENLKESLEGESILSEKLNILASKYESLQKEFKLEQSSRINLESELTKLRSSPFVQENVVEAYRPGSSFSPV